MLRVGGLAGMTLLAGCRSEQARFAAVVPSQRSFAVARLVPTRSAALVTQGAPAGLADGSPPAPPCQPAPLRAHRLAGRRKLVLPARSPAAATLFHTPSRAMPSATDVPPNPKRRESGGTLSGVLLLVPILGILALVGVSAGVAAVLSIGFWPALGWTTLVVMGALLLALAVAILRGK